MSSTNNSGAILSDKTIEVVAGSTIVQLEMCGKGGNGVFSTSSSDSTYPFSGGGQ